MPVPDLYSPTSNYIEKPRIKKHKQYYMPEGDIVLLVENTLFRVELKTIHSHSPVFRNFVPLPRPGQVALAGFTDKRPLVLREVTVVEFVRLLTVIYPLDTDAPSTIEEYLSVLKLATSFEMEAIRKYVTEQLDQLPMDPIRKITIWEEYQLDSDLLRSAYATLCQQPDPLTMTMTMTLGIRNFTKLAACRERYREDVGCLDCQRSVSPEECQEIAEIIVAGIFNKRKSTAERNY